MSAGSATALVRDGNVEGRDPPPNEPFKVTPVRIKEDGSPSDLRRADNAQQGSGDTESPAERAWDIAGETMP